MILYREFPDLQLIRLCAFCQHYQSRRRCAAFGTHRIPEEIWSGRNDHTAPFPGDQGLRFELVPGAEQGWARMHPGQPIPVAVQAETARA
jgi:hypothetical protein